MNNAATLVLENVTAGYPGRVVLKDVSVTAEAGKVTCIVGRNGCGKSTLLRVASGVLSAVRGRIVLGGRSVDGDSPNARTRAGLVFLPQAGGVFESLTVRENLELSRVSGVDEQRYSTELERVLAWLPTSVTGRLNRRADILSGGERQLVALARAMLACPSVLLLDEPSVGLSPSKISWLMKFVRQLCDTDRTTILVSEQRVRNILQISDYAYVLRNGNVSYSGNPQGLLEADTLARYFF